MQLSVIDRYRRQMGKRYSTVRQAFECLTNVPNAVIVELGTSRSFVPSGQPGVCSPDPKYWQPDAPDVWDWGAGVFTRVCAEVIAGTSAVLHTVDPDGDAITIAKTMTDGIDSQLRFHQTTSTEFLMSFAGSIDLLYMDHMETSEEGASLHRSDAEVVCAGSGLLSEHAVVLVDDVYTQSRIARTLVKAVRALRGDDDMHYGKGRYSIPYLTTQGFRVVAEAYQVLLQR